MSKTIDKVIYARAAALIASGWTQETYARDTGGVPVSPFAKTAVRFCAWGALQRAAWEVIGDKNEAMAFVMKVSDIKELIRLNDSKFSTQAVMRIIFETRAR